MGPQDLTVNLGPHTRKPQHGNVNEQTNKQTNKYPPNTKIYVCVFLEKNLHVRLTKIAMKNWGLHVGIKY